MRGGYKIIDFKNVPLETGGATMMIKGIHDTIEGNFGKAIKCSGVNIDGKEMNEFYSNPTLSGTDFKITINNKTITITDVDGVSVA